MTFKLWLDDDAGKEGIADWRNPPNDEFLVAHNSDEAMGLIAIHGIPSFIDFDHDLGENDTAMVFLRRLSEEYPEGISLIDDYRIHSANPDGAKNIKAFMYSWKKSLSL